MTRMMFRALDCGDCKLVVCAASVSAGIGCERGVCAASGNAGTDTKAATSLELLLPRAAMASIVSCCALVGVNCAAWKPTARGTVTWYSRSSGCERVQSTVTWALGS